MRGKGFFPGESKEGALVSWRKGYERLFFLMGREGERLGLEEKNTIRVGHESGQARPDLCRSWPRIQPD